MPRTNTIEARITLDMGELLHDIRNKSHLTGEARRDGQNFEAVANMQADSSDQDTNQVLRSITNADASLRNLISEYLGKCDSGSNNWQIEPGTASLQYDLLLPANFNHYGFAAIRNAMHQYIVNRTLGEWFLITNKTDSKEYFALAEANLAEITEAINRRRRPMRRDDDATDLPFWPVTDGTDNSHWTGITS